MPLANLLRTSILASSLAFACSVRPASHGHPRNTAFEVLGTGTWQPKAPGKTKRLRPRTSSNRMHDGHYLFGPSAIPMERGTGYYQNQDVLLHSIYFAPSDGMALGGGIQVGSLFSTAAGGSKGPMVHARLTAGGEMGSNIHAGGFVMGFRSGVDISVSEEVSIPSTLGLAAGQVTLGTDPFHITTSIGVSFDRNGMGESPLLGIAALWHVSGRVALLSENWHLPLGSETYRVYSLGARFVHRSMAFDGAFAFNSDLVDITPLGAPVIGFSLRF